MGRIIGNIRGTALLGIAASLILSFGALVALTGVSAPELSRSAASASRTPDGTPHLVSIHSFGQPFPELDGEMCEWLPASAPATLSASFQAAPSAAQDPGATPHPTGDQVAMVNARQPIRMIKDHYASYSSIAVDLKNDEVVMTDESLFNILTYARTENTPPTATMSEPRRMIGGLNTWVEYQCGVYIDQTSGDIYAVNNDTVDRLVIFSRDARGNVAPDRLIHTPHTTYGIAVDEPHEELFLTVQEASAVSVFRKSAEDHDAPIRLLQGNNTLLADPHGIAIDSTRDLLFVGNFGSTAEHDASAAGQGGTGGYFDLTDKPNWPLGRESQVPGTGKYLPASITIYPRDASGDVAPLRVISGPRTELNWPTSLAVDTKRGHLYVANDTGDSVLIFDVNAEGDVPPIAFIKGPKTLIKSPTGVFFDWEHDEVFVSNFGNHTATVYKATANGNVAPLRVIRSAPLDTPTPNIGNAYAPAYDSKRDQILVPN